MFLHLQYTSSFTHRWLIKTNVIKNQGWYEKFTFNYPLLSMSPMDFVLKEKPPQSHTLSSSHPPPTWHDDSLILQGISMQSDPISYYLKEDDVPKFV